MANIVKAWAWQCQECQRECVPIRTESRCMCGHRLKEHTEGHKCSNRSCSCPKFSFIVAEGSWILRCRCKHKHTEHDPSSHACSKASCSCSGFSSPWVCNCDHPWTQHQQVLVERQVLRLSDMLAQAHQTGSSSKNEPQEKEFAPVAEAAAAAGTSLSLQDMHISSSTTATVSPAAGAPDGAGGSVLGSKDGAAESATTTTSTSSSSSNSGQAGKLSSSTTRLQQLKQQRQHQVQQKCTAGTTLGSPAMPHSTEGRTPAAAAGVAAATGLGGKGEEQLLVQADLICDVNRWDLLQRGVGRSV